MLFVKKIIEESEKYIYLLIAIIDIIKYFAIKTCITDLVNDYIYHWWYTYGTPLNDNVIDWN